MSKQTLIFAIVLLFTSFFTACSTDSSNLDGQIVIWHSWQGAEAQALQKMLEEFRELHPEVGIAIDFYPASEIEEAYQVQVEAGLGPDMLVAPADWAARLNEARAIQEISHYEVDLDQYLSAAIDTLRTDDALYGLPLSLNTSILYYNKQLLQAASISTPKESPEGAVTELIQAKQESITDTQTTAILDELLTEVAQNDAQAQSEPLLPPSELNEILEQANAGQLVAMPPHGAP